MRETHLARRGHKFNSLTPEQLARWLGEVARCGCLLVDHDPKLAAGIRYVLPDGSRTVPAKVAQALIRFGFLAAVDDGLLPGFTQTFRVTDTPFTPEEKQHDN